MQRLATLTLALGLVLAGAAFAATPAVPGTPAPVEVNATDTPAPATVTLEDLFQPVQPTVAYPTPCDLACTETCHQTEPGSVGGICTRGFCVCYS